MNEQVLVIPRTVLNDYGAFQGFARVTQDYKMLLDVSRSFYADRAAAEDDTTLKQLIPYVVFARYVGGEIEILSYYRTTKGGEGRLHGKASIGIGGHINSQDSNYETAMIRELREEIAIPDQWTADMFPVIGLINDETTPVGAVHLGIVHLCVDPFTAAPLSAVDAGLSDCAWRPPVNIRQMDLESWSALSLDGVVDAIRDTSR